MVPSSLDTGIDSDSHTGTDSLVLPHTSVRQYFRQGRIAAAGTGTATTIAGCAVLWFDPDSDLNQDSAFEYWKRLHGPAPCNPVGSRCRYLLVPLVHCSSTSAHLLGWPCYRA